MQAALQSWQSLRKARWLNFKRWTCKESCIGRILFYFLLGIAEKKWYDKIKINNKKANPEGKDTCCSQERKIFLTRGRKENNDVRSKIKMR